MAESSESVAESVPDAKIALPSELFRTVVSLLLFVHLFSVGLGIATGSAAGSSALLTNIKMRTPGIEPYLWQLWLDHGYDYQLINFMPMFDDTSSMDWPYHLEATLNYTDGRPSEVVEIPGDKVWPADRRERLQQLPKSLAAFSQWPEGPTIGETVKDHRHEVGGSIGAALLREHPGAESVALRWYYHRGLISAETRQPDPPTWTPTDPRFFVTVGRMVVTLVDDQPQSMDILPQGEISPLKPQSRDSKSSSSTGASGTAAPVASGVTPPATNAPAQSGAPKDGSAKDASAKSKAESN